MSNIEWTDPRQRVATLSGGHQEEVERLMGQQPLEADELRGRMNGLADDIDRLRDGMREYAILQAKKGLAFDLLGAAIDVWAEGGLSDPAMTQIALEKIATRLAELRADMAVTT